MVKVEANMGAVKIHAEGKEKQLVAEMLTIISGMYNALLDKDCKKGAEEFKDVLSNRLDMVLDSATNDDDKEKEAELDEIEKMLDELAEKLAKIIGEEDK